jgi:phosphoribosylanthranilate isomerase
MRVKICGLTTPAAVRHAAGAGAAYLGFNFYPPSPRSIDLDLARAVVAAAPPGIVRVALIVDADDSLLDALLAAVPIDMLQLHGSETPERVAEVRAKTGLPVMKSVGIRTAEDLLQIAAHEDIADQLLVDAKPPREGADFLPGGNGLSFDWRLIAGRTWARPWMLAGGLTAENVAEAVRLTGARQIDVASGVESAPGVKDPDKVSAFIAAAMAAVEPAGLPE